MAAAAAAAAQAEEVDDEEEALVRQAMELVVRVSSAPRRCSSASCASGSPGRDG